jgi:hypothetical protein
MRYWRALCRHDAKSSPQREAVRWRRSMACWATNCLTPPIHWPSACRAIKGSCRPAKAGLAENLQQLNGAASGKDTMMVHGLCMNDLQWTAAGHSPDLARELGYTPVYLHYNTGQHTSISNSSMLLEQYCRPGHSRNRPSSAYTVHNNMGGLVARSACSTTETGQPRLVLKKSFFWARRTTARRWNN